jgi:hypothetical protein
MEPVGPPDIEQLLARKNRRGLVEALSYRADFHVRLAAALALEELGWKPADHSEVALYSIAKGKFTWCLEIGLPAVAPLCEALLDPDERIRRQAALALGKLAEQLKAPETSSAIARAMLPLLLDTAEGVRGAAQTVLAQCGEAGVEALCELAIEGESDQVKLAALQILAEQGPASTGRLMETIYNRSWLLQAGDLKILGESRDARWLDILIQFLQNPQNWPARASAAEALAKLGQPQAVGPLIKTFFEACAVYDQIQRNMKAAEFEQVYRELRKEVLAQPELAPEAQLLSVYRPAAPEEKMAGDVPAARSLMAACAQALTSLGGKSAANGLILALRVPAGKEYALQSMPALKDIRAVPGLRGILNEQDRALRRDAEDVLRLLGVDV